VVTDTGHPSQTHRQDRLQYIAPLASAQCNEMKKQCVTSVAFALLNKHKVYEAQLTTGIV